MKIEGFREVMGMFNRKQNGARQRAQLATNETLEDIASTARQLGTELWHKRPQESVPTIRANTNGKFVEMTGVGGFFQEIGTVNHPPKPVIGPSVDKHMPTYYRKLGKIIGGD